MQDIEKSDREPYDLAITRVKEWAANIALASAMIAFFTAVIVWCNLMLATFTGLALGLGSAATVIIFILTAALRTSNSPPPDRRRY